MKMVTSLRSAAGIALLVVIVSGCTVGADFSPDGRQIVFPWQSDGTRGLALMRTDGTGFRYIWTGGEADLPLWSPDGRFIAFVAAEDSPDGAEPTAYLYDIRRGTTRRLTSSVTPVAWREDGQRLLAIEARDDHPTSALWFTPTGELAFETALPRLYSIGPFVWLPGSDAIAVAADDRMTPDGSYSAGVYLVEPGGTRRLGGGGRIWSLALSADRRSLLWARSFDSARTRTVSLYAYDLRQGATSRLPFSVDQRALAGDEGLGLESLSAVLSPDGTRVALLATYSAPAKPNSRRPNYRACYVVRLDGTGLFRVARTRTDDGGTPPGPLLFLTWSHDGRQLLIQTVFDDAGNRLAIYNADGTGKRLLLQSPLK